MICKNCGAEFDAQLARCPYCNAMNEVGAKRQFNRKLKHILHKMNLISELPQKTVLTVSGKLLVLIIIIICAIVIVEFAKFKVNDQKLRLETTNEQEDFQKAIAWEKETFPKLDAWYEAGDYDKIYEFQCNLKSPYNIHNWQHSEFILIYGDYNYILLLRNIQEDGVIHPSNRSTALYNALQFCYDNDPEQLKLKIKKDLDHNVRGLTEQEVALINEYRQDCQDFLKDEFAMTQEDMDILHNKCLNSKRVFDVCEDFIKERDAEGGN